MIKPTEEYIIVKPDEAVKKTAAGIYMPENMESDIPITGTVYSFPVSDKIPVPFKKGIKVWVKMWAGNKIEYKGKELLSVHKKDIVAYEE